MIPKFRRTNRLLKWIAENNYSKMRLPKENEAVFFKSNEDESTIAHNLVNYAEETYKDDLDHDLENVISKNAGATVRYIQHLSRYGKNIRPEIIYFLKGDGAFLCQISREVGRLPLDLEADIKSPNDFLTYFSGLCHRGEKTRLIDMENRIFINNDSVAVPSCVAKYANLINELPQELKDILKKDNAAIMEYQAFISRKNKFIDNDLMDCLAGDDENLFKLASNYLSKRLPEHLEKTMSNPKSLFDYARLVVRNRLPEELENHLVKDHKIAVDYAFNIIRAYASVRLPEVVHSAIVMKSFEVPNDSTIKRYINECDRDTSVPGSW